MCYTVKSIDDVRNLVIATRGLSGLSALHALVNKACRRMFDLIAADVAAIAIYDGVDTLILCAAEGTTAPVAGTRLPRGSGLAWRALERNMPTPPGNCATDDERLDDLGE